MKTIKLLILSLLILMAFNSCSFLFRNGRGHVRVVFPPRNHPQPQSQKNPPQQNTEQEPDSSLNIDEMVSKALSCYRTARRYETQYYTDQNTFHARTAIENYRQYYILQPDGPYACIALLKCAELLHRIGENDKALLELQEVKKRKDFQHEFKREIRLIETLIND